MFRINSPRFADYIKSRQHSRGCAQSEYRWEIHGVPPYTGNELWWIYEDASGPIIKAEKDDIWRRRLAVWPSAKRGETCARHTCVKSLAMNHVLESVSRERKFAKPRNMHLHCNERIRDKLWLNNINRFLFSEKSFLLFTEMKLIINK